MSPPPEDSLASSGMGFRPGSAEPKEFSPEERTLLLKLAHEAIASALERREMSLAPPSPHLADPRGVFTTLYYRGNLRGCIGQVFAIAPLYRAVVETARGAAFEDARFPPLTYEELPEVEVSLSILSPLQPIQPEQVEIGRHGLLIKLRGHRGLLLPQVPVEHAWDRITFLEQTCIKAGLPPNAWQAGAEIEAFTAEVFGDGAVR
jgi:AmmeMemoRadiSam system protein A